MHTPIGTRQARHADATAVASFTSDTWGEKHGDYVADVFDEWVDTDGPTQRTFVATIPLSAAPTALDGDGIDDDLVVDRDGESDVDDGESEVVVGCVQCVMLSEWEAWGQGIRVASAARGMGVSASLTEAVFDWARDRGATVCRNMVFSWNVPGLGQSRGVGFDPCTEFRFARPTPEAGVTPDLPIAGAPSCAVDEANPDAAWSFWTGSDAHAHLRGLAMDEAETWALSTLTREGLHDAADDGRLLTVRDGGVAGMACRSYTYDREDEVGGMTTWAIYGVAAWRDAESAAALLRAIACDAAEVGADRTRVLVPETVEAVSDAAAAHVSLSDEPDFVLAADLTDPAVGRFDG